MRKKIMLEIFRILGSGNAGQVPVWGWIARIDFSQ